MCVGGGGGGGGAPLTEQMLEDVPSTNELCEDVRIMIVFNQLSTSGSVGRL